MKYQADLFSWNSVWPQRVNWWFLPLLFTPLWYIDNLAIHNQYEDYSVLGFNCLDYFFQKYNISSKHCMYVSWFTSAYNKYDMQGKMKNITIVHLDAIWKLISLIKHFRTHLWKYEENTQKRVWRSKIYYMYYICIIWIYVSLYLSTLYALD